MAANTGQPTPRLLTLATEKSPAESTIRCTGDIVTETAAKLRETARSLIGESKCVVFDFKGVNYLDSSGVGVIVGLLVSARKSGCKLRFVHLSRQVEEIFALTRVFSAHPYWS
jgi:anti-sigma B factor antagonist